MNITLFFAGKELPKISTSKRISPCGNPLALNNGNVLSAFNDGLLTITTPKGEIPFQTNLESKRIAFFPVEFADGTIAVSNIHKISFLSPQLQLKKQTDQTCLPEREQHAGLIVCPEPGKNISFIDSNGIIKYSFKTERHFLVSHVSLTNNLSAFMVTDGNIYFLDDTGKTKSSHLHNTKFYSHLVIVSDNVLAYRNRTEIVFLDYQGKELGTFEMPKARILQNIELLVGLGDGTVVASEEGGVLHFIKVN